MGRQSWMGFPPRHKDARHKEQSLHVAKDFIPAGQPVYWE